MLYQVDYQMLHVVQLIIQRFYMIVLNNINTSNKNRLRKKENNMQTKANRT